MNCSIVLINHRTILCTASIVSHSRTEYSNWYVLQTIFKNEEMQKKKNEF